MRAFAPASPRRRGGPAAAAAAMPLHPDNACSGWRLAALAIATSDWHYGRRRSGGPPEGDGIELSVGQALELLRTL